MNERDSNDEASEDSHSSSSSRRQRRRALHSLDGALDDSTSHHQYIFTDDDDDDDRSEHFDRSAKDSDRGADADDDDIATLLAVRYTHPVLLAKRGDKDAEADSSDSTSSSPLTESPRHYRTTTATKTKQQINVDPLTARRRHNDLERAPPPPPPLEKSASLSLLGRLTKDRRKYFLFGNNNRKHRSAVNLRHDQFAHDDWEVQAAPRSLFRASMTNTTSPIITATTTTPSSPPVRSVGSSVVASIIREQRKRDRLQARHHADVCQDGLDCRLTADHVADVLDLGDDAQIVLRRYRGRSGAVEMEVQSPPDDGGGEMVPYLHVAGDVWIPHYEEYVVRAVEAFTRFLRKPSLSPLTRK